MFVCVFVCVREIESVPIYRLEQNQVISTVSCSIFAPLDCYTQTYTHTHKRKGRWRFFFPPLADRTMDREENSNYVERGFLRSGARFSARNNPYYSSVQELLSHHRRLLENEPAVTTRIGRVGEFNSGSLLQTTIRFRSGYQDIRSRLRLEFLDLFREHTEGPSDGFEVVVTFNAILTNQDSTSFSIFFGHDFRAGNHTGAAPQLRYGDTILIRTLADLHLIPTSFNFEEIIHSHRAAFLSSNVRLHQILNVVYLVYRYFGSRPAPRYSHRPSGRRNGGAGGPSGSAVRSR